MNTYGSAKCYDHNLEQEWLMTNSTITRGFSGRVVNGVVTRLNSNGDILHHDYCINSVRIPWKYLSKYE